MPRKFLWRQPFGSRRDWGEHVVCNELQEALVRRKDDTTQVLVNCIIPSRDKGDREADFVVIGPYGATVIEVKNFAGPVQFDGQQGCTNGTRKMPKDPRTQAKEAAQRLHSFFRERL